MVKIKNAYFHKRFLVFIIPAALLALILLAGLYKKPLQWIGSVTGATVYFVQEGTYNLIGAVRGTFQGYFFLVGLHQENTRLKKEIEQLQGKIHQLNEQEALAGRLGRILEFKQSSPLHFIAASVIGRETGPWFHTLMINKGSAEGIKVDMGVMTQRGVVGKVIKTFSHHAQVLLMTDPNSAMAAIVQRTRDEGIVQGMGKNQVRLKYLPRFAEVTEGDMLITSGLEGSFAKGIPIGRIQKIDKQGDDFFLNVTVTPEIAFLTLEEVLVLIPTEGPVE